MTTENRFVQKVYYETFLSENEIAHPIRVLGEAYEQEQKTEVPDLSYIRFAQGEIYYHNKDYEAAIFKWENITNEFEDWAKKNLADAYYQLEIYKTAEEIYKSITTDSVLLNTEIGMQLFSLYINQGKRDHAFKIIQKVVDLNPGYSNVSDKALKFYEEQHDLQNAVELIISEAIRTEAPHWFAHLTSYAEKGHMKAMEPQLFTEFLTVFYGVNQEGFEDMILLISQNYQTEQDFFNWTTAFNEVFSNLSQPKFPSYKVSTIFKEMNSRLMTHRYSLKKLQSVIPQFLTNWLNWSKTSIASAAALAWNELFPESLTQATVIEAEHRFQHAEHQAVSFKEIIQFFDSIMDWAQSNDVALDYRLEWLIGEICDLRKNHLLIAEMNGENKASFLNFVLGEKINSSRLSNVMVYQYQREMEMIELTANEVTQLKDFSLFHSPNTTQAFRTAGRSIVDVKYPCSFLYKNKLAIMDPPSFNREEIIYFAHAADSMLLFLDEKQPLNENELEVLVEIRDKMPNLNVHFILKIDHTLDVYQLIEQTKLKVRQYFPKSGVYPYSEEMSREEQEREWTKFFEAHVNHKPLEAKRTEKLLYFIRKAISNLLEKRVELEQKLTNTIVWEEELLSKLTGAKYQLEDLEQSQIQTITQFYYEKKEEIKRQLQVKIPTLLKECSQIITEESDFGNIHLRINDEMNARVHDYLENNVLPRYYKHLKEWIYFSENEMDKSQSFLNEMSSGFQKLLENDSMTLLFEEKIGEDWRRDVKRMTSGVTLEKVNFINKFSPSQFLLKSAGKLFGSIGQNHTILGNKYKAFIENEDYQEVTDLITSKFMSQFELFEKTFARDVNLSFQLPIRKLTETFDELKETKRKNELQLIKLQENPEMFRDPLTIFEVRLRHFEWMVDTSPKIELTNKP